MSGWYLSYNSSMADHQELGITIRKARLDKSMSLGQLASAVGRSSSSVRRWERGEVAPAASVRPKLAAILEIDPKLLEDGASSSREDSIGVIGGSGGEDGRVSTVEQPAIGASGSGEIGSPLPPESSSTSQGRFRGGTWVSFTHRDRGWVGWVRGLLTVAALVGMLFVMLWAVSELFDAFGAVLDSFNVGSGGG